ncbi:hypothetical protein [Agromyces ramosus]|uniref:Uncharacterized protein n=1 Tax=Agromyces ramosus TaxID=33879 RepID=A0ABU0R474_9MICO|nr:hypothetical protein [Agromyces ramosus]MDQ0892877.1 hypothetical protein [Agromyces ramosus]
MDPNLARQTLRILPDSPLTVELVERAFAGESWARHPSRYQDVSARRQAEEWAQTLVVARDVLLAEARTSTAPHPSVGASVPVSTPAPRRGLSSGAVIGIVAGSVAVLALITAGVFGATTLATNALTTATERLESAAEEAAAGAEDDTEFADVERMQSGETMYAFPAALEMYNDNRHGADCPIEFAEGCWQVALFTEADCRTIEVELGFTDDIDAYLPEHLETIEKHDVVGNEATVVVFGNDDYGYGWINQVTCLDTAS